MNDEEARQGLSDTEPLASSLSGRAALTPLQTWLVALYCLLEDAREGLTPDAWRAFVWIAADRVGHEAARLVVAEALDATEEAA